jgi:N-acetylneuraminic acid mutarotase
MLLIIVYLFIGHCSSVLAFGSVPNARALGDWIPQTPMPSARSGVGMVSLNGLIYVLGGSTCNTAVEASSDVLVYDPITTNWSQVASMQQTRYQLCAVVYNDLIYAINGHDKADTSVEAYNPDNNTWWYVGNTTYPHTVGAAAVANGTIYVMGGWLNSRIMEAYNPGNDTWSTMAPMHNARQGLSAATIKNIIYTIGGYMSDGEIFTPLSVAESYDARTDTWTDIKGPSSVRALSGCASVGNNLLLVAGGAGTINGTWRILAGIQSTEIYDIANNTWNKGGFLTDIKYSFGMASLMGNLYVVGGARGTFDGAPIFNSSEALNIVEYAGDITPPEITITSPIYSGWSNLINISFEGNVYHTNDLYKVKAQLNDDNWINCSMGYDTWSCRLTLKPGINVMRVRAIDQNRNANWTSVMVKIDITNPEIQIISPKTGGVVSNPNISLAGTASDNVELMKVEASIDRRSWTPCTGLGNWAHDSKLASGNNVIHLRAVDEAGNSNITAITVYLDDRAPNIKIDRLTNYNVSKSVIRLYGNVTDDLQVQKLEININGALWIPLSGNSSWSYNATLNVGRNNISVRAFDSMGNQGNTSIELTYTPKKPETKNTPGFNFGLVIVVVSLTGLLISLNRGKGFWRFK